MFNFKELKFYIIALVTVILLAVGIGLLPISERSEPDLSLLNIDNFLSSMATASYITVETADGTTLNISPDVKFLTLFEQKKWQEMKVKSPIESSAILKIKLQDGYYSNFYSFEDYAMVYNDNTQEKFRYYKIPQGIYKALESYVLENGEPLNRKNTGETDVFTAIGHISEFVESGGTHIIFDPVEWITSEDTDRIKELGLKEYDMPNGYYIYNSEIEELVYEVNENTEYIFIDWGFDFADSNEERANYSTTDKKEFIEYLNTYTDKAAKVPFWIKQQDGVIHVIKEQYVP